LADVIPLISIRVSSQLVGAEAQATELVRLIARNTLIAFSLVTRAIAQELARRQRHDE